MHALESGRFEKALENHNRLLALKAAFLPSLLKNGESERDEAAHGLTSLLSAFSGATVRQLATCATPFFGFNVQRCAAAVSENDGDAARMASYLLSAAFDAFYELLPDDCSMQLGAGYDCDLRLPRLRVRIPASSLPATLRRVSRDCLEIETKEGVHRLSGARRPAAFEDPSREIPGSSARLLLAPNHSLVDDVSALESAPESHDTASLLSMMSGALSLIADTDPRLSREIGERIGWYVPVKSSDLKFHRSFTVEGQPGVIFLSEALDLVLLAEAVIHEFYHTVLDILTETEDLFGGVDSAERFYSPWRDDPRPLSGLFHAIYVFSGVEAFYAAAGGGLKPAQAEIVDQRRAKLHRQLRLGLAQLPLENLPDAAAPILRRIQAGLDSSRPRLENDKTIVETLESHFEEWSRRNPKLASRVRRPS